jgi:hypothetical protein
MYVLCARGDALLPLRIALQARLHLLHESKKLWLCWLFIFLFLQVGHAFGKSYYVF